MRRKKLVLAVCVAVLLGGYTAGIYGQEAGELTQDQTQAPNTEENRTDIARSVLESTGRSEQYDLADLEKVTVYFGGDVTGNEEDIVVTVHFGPKNTVVAAYTADGNVYQFIGDLGDLGDFYGVQSIQFVPVEDLGKDIVIIREQVDGSLGGFEQTDVLRGYAYDGKEFRNVLNTPQKIEASWNQIWNQSDIQQPSLWQRITEETESKWNGGEEPSVTITRYQTYLESDDTAKETIPQDNTFTEKESRVVVERFFWSPQWNRFILREATEKATGETVAVIENLTLSPYMLAGFEDNKDYRILRADGSTDYVEEGDLAF